MEGVITYRARGAAFILFSVGTAWWLLAAVVMVAATSPWAFMALVFASMFVYLATKQTRRVELHADGTLFIHLWLRPTRKISIRDVQRIEKNDETGTWTVAYRSDGGRTLELRDTDTAVWLVHSLVRRRPQIELVNYTIPPL